MGNEMLQVKITTILTCSNLFIFFKAHRTLFVRQIFALMLVLVSRQSSSKLLTRRTVSLLLSRLDQD